jgi:hypothetical protein
VAIGAGLSRLPKRKRKKPKRYVEPGGSMPMLSFTLIGMLFGGAYIYRPWDDDWDLVRAWLGEPRHHSIKGDWYVIETLRAYNSAAGTFDNDEVSRGEFVFGDGGKVTIKITNSFGEIDAMGAYEVTGEHVNILNITPAHQYSSKLPSKLSMDLGWNGANAFIAVIGPGDTLFMNRADGTSDTDTDHRELTAQADGSHDIGGTMSQSDGG